MEFEERWRQVRETRYFSEFYFISLSLVLAFGVLSTSGEILQTERPVVTVTSCSMYPEYDVGDVILVKGQGFEEYKVGDIVVYDANSKKIGIPIIHRVVEKNEDHLETMGDNTQGQHSFEKKVEPRQIYGEAVLSLPKAGAVKLLFMDLLGYGRTNVDSRPNPPLSLEFQYFCSRTG